MSARAHSGRRAGPADRRRRARLLAPAVAVAAVLVAAGLLAWALLQSGPTHGPTHSGAAPVPVTEPTLFSPRSIWNAPLPADAPIDPASSQLVSGLLAEVQAEEQAGVGPWLATSTASTPIYIVPADEPTVDVSLDDPGLPWRRSLAYALQRVPIPPGARPARGRDAQMTIWQPATDRLWELFHARLESDGWHAAWGGAMRDVSRSPGYYTAASWPGAQANWGATATSFPVAAGVITLAQIRAGTIDHALALDLPHPRAGVVAWPAQRGDGTGPPSAIPEGAHLRLDPHLDLDALSMPPLTRMIAVAAQRYGLIVRDGAPAISLFAEDPTQYGGGRLYWGRHAIFGGLTPQQILAAFPWSHLEVLHMALVRVPRASKFLDAALKR